jgi:hypothetical protein
LLECLEYQRASALAIPVGLEESLWHRSIVPSGWTIAGVIDHLAGAERHWFQLVVTGHADELPWDVGRPDYDPHAPMTCDRPSADIVAYYREQCKASNAVLFEVALTDRTRGRHGGDDVGALSVREVVLHMIEETASHSGHVEIARELLDGATGLGGR